ncbi:MAG: twin-arginine translocase subunit TatC [Phycisphaerae bacterium]
MSDRLPPEDTLMSFGDHLEELRSSVIQALVGVAICAGVCLFFGLQILKIICKPLLAVQAANGLQPTIQALSPTAGFIAYIKIGILSGLILAMPWVIYQVWRFVVTGLYPSERRFFKWLVGPSALLFTLGVMFMYFIVLPIVLQFFISFNASFGTTNVDPNFFQSLLIGGEEPVELSTEGEMPHVQLLDSSPENPQPGSFWIDTQRRRLMVRTAKETWSVALQTSPSSPVMQSQFAIDFYISFVLMLSLAFGLAFETPLVVFFLTRAGIVTTDQMAGARRFVVLGVVCVAAMLTPPDVISQLLLAVPMYVLFEAGLYASKLSERRTRS